MRDNQADNFSSLKKKDNDYQNSDKSNNDLKTIIKFKKLIDENDIEQLNYILERENIKEQTLSNGLNLALEQYRPNGNTIDIINSLLKYFYFHTKIIL